MIKRHCENAGIDPLLFAALIYEESRGDPWAIRYEESWFKRLLLLSASELQGEVPRGISLAQEKRQRSISWGLCQVLGETARELGFSDTFLSELCSPSLGVLWGIRVFSFKRDIAKRKLVGSSLDAITRQTLLFYNGGADLEYDDRVLGHIETGMAQTILDKYSDAT